MSADVVDISSALEDRKFGPSGSQGSEEVTSRFSFLIPQEKTQESDRLSIITSRIKLATSALFTLHFFVYGHLANES